MKKFLSILLVLTMVLAMVPAIGLSASAAGKKTLTGPAVTDITVTKLKISGYYIFYVKPNNSYKNVWYNCEAHEPGEYTRGFVFYGGYAPGVLVVEGTYYSQGERQEIRYLNIVVEEKDGSYTQWMYDIATGNKMKK